MNRNNFILVLILFLSFISEALSATNVQTDYIVTLQKDTVFGTIIPISPKYSPASIGFKKDERSELQVYNPTQINSFSIKNNLYVSRKVAVSKVDVLAVEQFLFVYNLGKVSLYGYSSPDIEQIFFIEKNDTIRRLIYTKTEVINEDGIFENENLEFRKQLAKLLIDCPVLYKQISEANYYDRDLMKIVKKYNEAFPAQNSFVTKKEKEKITIHLGASAGISLGSLKFSNEEDNFAYLVNSNYNSLLPSFGVNIEYQLPMLNRRFAFYQEIAYLSNKYEDTYKSENEIDRTVFDLSYLRLSNMLRFTFYRNNLVSTYFGAGFISGLAVNKNTKRYNSSTMGGTTITTESDVIPSYPSIQFAYGASAGITYKRFTFEYRLDKGSSISEYMFHLNSYQLNQFVNIQYTIK